MRLIGRIFDVIYHHQQLQKLHKLLWITNCLPWKLGRKYSRNLRLGVTPEETRLAVVVGCLELVDLVSTNIICSLFWLSRVRGLPTNPIEGCQEFISGQSEPLLADHCTSLVHGERLPTWCSSQLGLSMGNKSFQYQHANYLNSICLHPGGTELHVMFGVRMERGGLNLLQAWDYANPI